MTNLVDKYGRDWFNNKFPGSYFRFCGVPARVIQAQSADRKGGKSVVKIRLSHRVNNKVVASDKVVPADLFADSSIFNVPELGYRHAHNGKWLVFMRRNNSSYVRGLSTRNLNIFESQFTSYLRSINQVSEFLTEDETVNLVMEPTFVPLNKGIQLMLEGKLLSFAASSTVAVVPSHDSDNLSVMMCEKQVGFVTSTGELNINLPIAKNYVEESLCP